MKINLIKSLAITLILFMFFACPTTPATVESFTADMTQRIGNDILEGKIYVKGNKYRMDINEQGSELSIIVDHESGKQKILVHSRKIAEELWNNSERSLSNNPFESFYYALKKYSSKEKGSEVINGYNCKKIEIYVDDRKLLTAWVANKLNWPIKILTELGIPKNAELKNIKEEPVEENLFQLPENYGFTPLPEPKKEKDERLLNAEKNREAVYKKLEEKGIETETEDGTLKARLIFVSRLSRFFPKWNFFNINREKDILGKILINPAPVEKAAVNIENEQVYLLERPETDMRLESGLKMIQSQNIKLNTKEEIKEFAYILPILFFRSSKTQGVESLGENKWAIYADTAAGTAKGFIVELNNNGEIVDLNYKLKIKEK